MPDFDLLLAVQPEDGWFAVVGIKAGSATRQTMLATREEVDREVAKLVSAGYNVFFGVAKYATDESRKKDNVLALRSLWVDIDCGEGKPYASQVEGLAALKNFCNTVKLPKPIIVDSGRGLHVYWPLDEDVSRAAWEPVALRLKELAREHSFHADPSCFEAARILRVPGTFNFKGEEPLPVTVLNSAANPTPLGIFKGLLGVRSSGFAPDFARRELSPLAQQLVASSENSFAKIMQRGELGCAQLNSCYIERATLSEPRWFSALSVAKFCTDRDRAVYKLSADHPDYDPASVERKLRHIKGPHTCAEFDKNNPGLCEVCPHFGRIKSPIVLGKTIAKADPDTPVTDALTEQTYKIPEYPFPYFRGKGGGVWRKAVKDPQAEEEAEDMLVYQHDMYVVKRMEDPVLRGVTLIRLHLPQDGVREFVIPNKTISDVTELKKALAAESVLAPKKQMELIADYILRAFLAVQNKEKAEHMRNQFGWVDRDTKFILGDKEITVHGVGHSPPSSITAPIAANIETAGSFEKWKEVFNLYGRPGMEAHAFAAASGFGAPLLKFSGQRGAIINLIHPRSGTGKTTVLHMCNSIWGAPDRLCAKHDDTFNTKVHKLGVHSNLPICFDEMSNTEATQLSELAYMITQGVGKDRMKASTNELRVNTTTWRTIALCSSNHSFYEKLEVLKSSPEGEMMRIMEYHLDYSGAIDTAEAKHMFDHQLLENYGHAGERYIRYILENYEEVKATYLRLQGIIDTRLKLTQRERFWSATAAANLTGIYLAVRLGLCNWDLDRIFKWACKMILGLRETTLPPLDGAQHLLGEFILRHIDSTLIVNDDVDRRTKMQALPLLEPKRDLKIRYEPDTGRLYILRNAFKYECQLRKTSFNETLKQLKACGMYIGSEKKRMSKGTRISGNLVYALVFDATHTEFVSMDDLIPKEAEAGEAVGS